MTARLPSVGGDGGNWGTILNEFLQVGHNTDGTLKNVYPVFDVKADYGAVGDGVTDDAPAIQAALDAAGAAGGTVYLPPGVYLVNTELQIKAESKTIRVVGCGHDAWRTNAATEIRAGASMRSMLAIFSPRHEIENLMLFGTDTRYPTYGIYLSLSAGTIFRNVCVFKALLDGWHASSGGNNNGMNLTACYSFHNGTLHATSGIISQYTNGERTTITGSAAVSAYNHTVTITGGPDLRDLGIRRGDILRVTKTAGATKANSEYYFIDSVNANTITLENYYYNSPTFTGSGLDYAIGTGDGWHDVQHSDNGTTVFNMFISFSNGNAGLRSDGLYGHTVLGGDFSYNNMAGISVGNADNVSAVFESMYLHTYVEDVGVAYMIGNAQSLSIIIPMGIVPRSTDLLFSNNARSSTTNVIANGQSFNLIAGAPQQFIIQVTNAGALQHRFIADVANGDAPFAHDVNRLAIDPDSISGFKTTNSVGAGSGFNYGAGVSAETPTVLVFDTLKEQTASITGVASVELNTTGTQVNAALTTIAENVNGVTQRRAGIRLFKSDGTQFSWSDIPASKSIAVRLAIHLK